MTKVLGEKRTKNLFIICGFCAWRPQYFQSRRFPGIWSQKDEWLRQASPPYQNDLISHHYNNFLFAQSAQEILMAPSWRSPTTPTYQAVQLKRLLVASRLLRHQLVNKRFRFRHDRVPAALLRWRNISRLFIHHSRQTSHQVFRWWKTSWQDILKSIREMPCHLSAANECVVTDVWWNGSCKNVWNSSRFQ